MTSNNRRRRNNVAIDRNAEFNRDFNRMQQEATSRHNAILDRNAVLEYTIPAHAFVSNFLGVSRTDQVAGSTTQVVNEYNRLYGDRTSEIESGATFTVGDIIVTHIANNTWRVTSPHDEPSIFLPTNIPSSNRQLNQYALAQVNDDGSWSSSPLLQARSASDIIPMNNDESQNHVLVNLDDGSYRNLSVNPFNNGLNYDSPVDLYNPLWRDTLQNYEIGRTHAFGETLVTRIDENKWNIISSNPNNTIGSVILMRVNENTWDIIRPNQISDLVPEQVPLIIHPNQQTDVSENDDDNADADTDDEYNAYDAQLTKDLEENNKHLREMYERINNIVIETEMNERNDFAYLEGRERLTIGRLRDVDIKIVMINELRYELPKRKKKECGICFEKNCNFGKLPCCKVSYCIKCLEKCVKCPICRKRDWWWTSEKIKKL